MAKTVAPALWGRMADRSKVLLQYLLPKRRLTQLAGRVAGARGGSMTLRLIRWFVRRYGVDMSEAENSDIASYESFNAFFTRPLKAGARPLAKADFICPLAVKTVLAVLIHHDRVCVCATCSIDTPRQGVCVCDLQR